MPVEFLGIAATNDGSEITARSGASFDKDYTLRLARAHEENGWDRVLLAYGSGSPDPNAAAAYIASQTSTLQLLLAHRPNVSYPTFAAKTFATIDQISGGRVTVHFITGGTDHEQQREGDYLDPRRALRAHPRVHADHQAGLDVARAVRLRRRALPVRRLRQRRVPGAAATAPSLVRRFFSSGLPDRRGRGRHLLPVGRAAGEHRGADRVGAGGRQGGRARRMSELHGGRTDALEVSPNLWAGVDLVRGGAGTALVGSHEEVADRIAEYHELGIDEFILSGYPHLEEAYQMGEGVMPVLRRRGLLAGTAS